MKKTTKLFKVLLFIVIMAISVVGMAGCNNKFMDKLDTIIDQMSEMRKEMEKQQKLINELIGAENIQVVFLNPTQKLKNFELARRQELTSGYKLFTIKYIDVFNFAETVEITQLDVMKYLKSKEQIDFVFSEQIGMEKITITGTDYVLDRTGTTDYILNFTTVSKISPPAPGVYDYSFNLYGVEVISAYQSVPNAIVTIGSVMGFGFSSYN